MTRRARFYASIVLYPTLGWNYLMARIFRFRRWWDFVDPQVIVGARPFRRDVPTLRKLGVQAVVNTCEEYWGPVTEYARHGIEQLHLPTTDFTHPELADIVRGVEFVQKHVEANQVVYIHCKAGRARSATIALCWLVQYRGMSPAAAQHHLLKARPHVNPKIFERPVVQKFVAALPTKTEPTTSTL